MTPLEWAEDSSRHCVECRLCETRTHVAFGRGNPSARVMFVGDAPGPEEDLQGVPFVGPGGLLLDSMLGAMGIDPYICNLVKCAGRAPTADEIEQCSGYLRLQIQQVAPKVIVALGRPAARALGQTASGRWRGRWFDYIDEDRVVRVMPTFHPDFVLRQPEAKHAVGRDMVRVLKALGMWAPSE